MWFVKFCLHEGTNRTFSIKVIKLWKIDFRVDSEKSRQKGPTFILQNHLSEIQFPDPSSKSCTYQEKYVAINMDKIDTTQLFPNFFPIIN